MVLELAKLGSMLSKEPIGVGSGILQREVSLGSKLPQYISGAGAVAIINLQNPRLVPKGKQEISVVLGIDQRIGVSPVGKEHRMAVYIELVERIPDPNRIVVCIEVNDRISRNNCLPWISGKITERSLVADQ